MCKGLSSPILRYFELQIDFDTLSTSGARNRTPGMSLLIYFVINLQKKRHRLWTTFPRNSKCVHETKYNPNITLSYGIDKKVKKKSFFFKNKTSSYFNINILYPPLKNIVLMTAS